MKKLLSLLLSFILLWGALPALAEETVGETVSEIISETISEKTVPLYYNSLDEQYEIVLTFIGGQEDIPYISAAEMCRVMNLLFAGYCTFEVTVKDGETAALFERKDRASAYIDYEAGTMSFSQYDRFFAWENAANMLDAVITGGVREGREIDLIAHLSSYESSGGSTDVCLKDYSIPSPVVNGVGYLPLQTFSDLFIAPSGGALCYNGEIVIDATATALMQDVVTLTPLGELYYSVQPRNRSEALAEFTVNELCLALDFHYGLKAEHGITGFGDYFIRSGLLSPLLDTDPAVSNVALYQLCMCHFTDGHSALNGPSPWQQYGTMEAGLESASMGMLTKAMNLINYYSERQIAYPEGMPGYEEIGNTAYITFDAFIIDPEKDYYSAEIPENFLSENADTVELLIYANRMIRRENSPIENVVIDLSCNSGGAVDAAVCVCAWMLNIAPCSLQDMATGTRAGTDYMFDANLDHVYDRDTDCVGDKNLFCLISPVSFSCGNYVPATLHASGRVTLLGKASTGGACAVQALSTADGALLSVSGRLRLSTVNNGIFYSVDAGVEPHYYLPKMSMFYDRVKLTEYINGLMW